jgi:hypothetical protein
MIGPVKISYVNDSGYSIPPYGVVELSGSMQLLGNGERAIPVTRPTGKGPYAIDDGKGASSTVSGKYGTAIIPYDNLAWVDWEPEDSPGTAWQGQVGPLKNSFKMGKQGTGYLYAGAYDEANSRVLVVQKPYSPVRMVCVEMAANKNTWVYRAQSPPSTRVPTSFRAAIAQGFSQPVQAFLNSENSDLIFNVSTRFIAGGIFTGNEFIGIPVVSRLVSGSPAEYDVVQNPALYRFKAKAKGQIGDSGTVKISFIQECLNESDQTSTCEQTAKNDTGRNLTDGQNVWVEWTQDGWHITDFECNVTY